MLLRSQKEIKVTMTSRQKANDELHYDPFDQTSLPVVYANGRLTTVDRMTETERETFLRYLIRCTSYLPLRKGELPPMDKVEDDPVDSPRRPAWWPENLPYEYGRLILPSSPNKSDMLKLLIIKCYSHFNSDSILHLSNKLAALPNESIKYSKEELLVTALYDNKKKLLIKLKDENLFYDQREVFPPSDSSVESSPGDYNRQTDVQYLYERRAKNRGFGGFEEGLGRGDEKTGRSLTKGDFIRMQLAALKVKPHKRSSSPDVRPVKRLFPTLDEEQSEWESATVSQIHIEDEEPKKACLLKFGLRLEPNRRKNKESVAEPESLRHYMSKKKQKQLFQKVPFSSDLGRLYLKKVKAVTNHDQLLDKIERHCSTEGIQLQRRSEILVPANQDYESPTDYDHPSTSVERSLLARTERFYRFTKCRLCARNEHSSMKPAKKGLPDCFVRLERIPKDTRGSGDNQDNKGSNDRTSKDSQKPSSKEKKFLQLNSNNSLKLSDTDSPNSSNSWTVENTHRTSSRVSGKQSTYTSASNKRKTCVGLNIFCSAPCLAYDGTRQNVENIKPIKKNGLFSEREGGDNIQLSVLTDQRFNIKHVSNARTITVIDQKDLRRSKSYKGRVSYVKKKKSQQENNLKKKRNPSMPSVSNAKVSTASVKKVIGRRLTRLSAVQMLQNNL